MSRSTTGLDHWLWSLVERGEVVVWVSSTASLSVRISWHDHLWARDRARIASGHFLICRFLIFIVDLLYRLGCRCLLCSTSKATLTWFNDASLAQLVVVRLQAVSIQLSFCSTLQRCSLLLLMLLLPSLPLLIVFALFVIVIVHIAAIIDSLWCFMMYPPTTSLSFVFFGL